MWQGKRVSVILPTFNERDSIARCIEDFFELPYVDEVIVVDNNAVAGTKEEVAKTRARLVCEERQGYGFASRTGLREAKGDLLAICEPDGTFVAGDLEKLLVYSRDFDIVFGSRTLGWMIWENANMGWFLRLGNVLVAKLVQILFNCRSLSDVGCTFRLLSRDASDFILPHYRVGGSHFGPEMMLRSILSSCRVVQIPVNYLERVGHSSVTGDKWKAFALGLRMIGMILAFRLGSLLMIPRYKMPHLRKQRQPEVRDGGMEG
ncbi:MAG: glycosyltransferase family 2 protein [Candidatus Krumholzibacteria bacterium]|nr:glycosyltransferase family 2 protein [Candidatus Krumholzibacteria bacterium]